MLSENFIFRVSRLWFSLFAPNPRCPHVSFCLKILYHIAQQMMCYQCGDWWTTSNEINVLVIFLFSFVQVFYCFFFPDGIKLLWLFLLWNNYFSMSFFLLWRPGPQTQKSEPQHRNNCASGRYSSVAFVSVASHFTGFTQTPKLKWRCTVY